MQSTSNQFANIKKMGETLNDYSKINRLSKLLCSEEAIFDRFQAKHPSPLPKNASRKEFLDKPPSKSELFHDSSITQIERASRLVNNSVDVPSIETLSPAYINR